MNRLEEKYLGPAPARWMNGQTVPASVEDDSSPAGDAIPCYLRFPPLEDTTTRERLSRLNELTREGMPWTDALAATQEAALLSYVTDGRRGGFMELLPLHVDRDLLEIGPGLGQFTASLAKRSRSVHALEVVPGQAEFVLLRARQEGASNISVAIGGDDCRLPYRDAAFDGIVLNLVFEWCGSRIEGESHEQAQTRLLEEMVRVLKPGGFLYLSTKNRFALRLLLGQGDEHMFDLPFGSALPQRLSAWLLKRRGRERPMGKLYSHDQLEAKLQGAGLGEVRSFWAVPEMRFPAHYVPVDKESVRAARARPGFRQGHGRKENLAMRLMPSAWVRHVMPGLAFLAFKRPARS